MLRNSFSDSLHSCECPLEQLFTLPNLSVKSEDCHGCLSKDIKIEFLERKIALLNDIIKTSDLIAQFSDSIMTNESLGDLNVMSDCGNINESGNGSLDLSQCDSGNITITTQSLVVPNEIENADLSVSPIEEVKATTPEPEDDPNSLNSPELAPSAVYEPVTPGPLVAPFPVPVTILDDSPFSKFSLDRLVEEIEFSHKFQNRKATYYGDFPYEYKGASHGPRTVPTDSYLAKLRSYLGILLPNLKHNSMLINLYESGVDFIPPHSDSESCIVDDSDIVTVSLGATRTLQIKSSKSGKIVGSSQLQHGDVVIMSKSSQADFLHEILPEETCDKPRISITFRQIQPPRITQSSDFNRRPPPPSIHEGCGYVPPDHHPVKKNSKNPAPRSFQKESPKKSALFISSSMFRFLDPEKLSSPTISATKLFYAGADAKVMLSKLKTDLSTVPSPSVIYLMTGTNNVNSVYFGSKSLDEAAGDIDKLLSYLKSVYPTTPIHVINILPRSTKGRNDVVKELNKLIESICHNDPRVDFMQTQHLFNYRNGLRKEFYFVKSSAKIYDNCHLNASGVIRLAKFLKYWVHKQV